MRMETGGGDVVEDGVRDGFAFLGWSDAEGLLTCHDYWQFREIVHEAHYAGDDNYRRSGQAASQLWNFVHEIREGDLLVVPHPSVFYAGTVTGPAAYDPDSGPVDTAHRRRVEWFNSGDPIHRTYARSGLISRMRSRRTLTSAADLLDEITEAVDAADQSESPSLASSLRAALVETTKQQLLTGHMDSNRFENLVRDLMRALGAVDAHVVARRKDIGADIEAEFSVGHFTTMPVRIQVKYWRDQASREPVDQLLKAMADVELGIVVTTASFADEVRRYASDRADETGKQVILIDGDELCRLIVDHGLDVLLAEGTA